MKLVGSLLGWLALLLLLGWAGLALWFDGIAWLGPGLGCGVLCVLGLVRPLGRAAAILVAAFAVVLVWWLRIPASNDRDWIEDVARLPRARFEGSHVTIENVRNFDYRSETEWTPHWDTRSYDLDTLQGADFYLSSWGSPWIAHTIVSWEFAGDEYLAISIETRKEKGEQYSAVRGFFRQFELYYVVADERDVIRLRTNYRGEDVHLYRLTMPAPQARAVLVDYLEDVNDLAEKPRWYNALSHNCTTMIRTHAQNVGAGRPWNWRILVNGKIDELGYMRGTVDTSLPFSELKRRSRIVDAARAADRSPEFSTRIRQGVPNPRVR